MVVSGTERRYQIAGRVARNKARSCAQDFANGRTLGNTSVPRFQVGSNTEYRAAGR
jgi:hypothetical protein